jgi:UDP-glucose 4-epimerase
MKVLITGAGLIGCHSARELTSRGHQVTLYDLSPDLDYVRAVSGEKRVEVVQGDLLNLPNLLRVFHKIKPEAVVHTAGLIGSQAANPPYRGVQTNILGSTHVFEAAQMSRVERVVHVSTFGVYDWDHIRGGPVKESFPRWGTSFYSATKVANELLLGAYRNHYGFASVVIRPASVYGPGHYRGGSGGGKNMNDLIRACLGQGPVRLSETRIGSNDFVYAKDVAMGVALACTVKKAAGHAFNIGTGQIYNPADFLRALRRLLPGRVIRIVKDARGGRAGQERVRLDISLARKVLGYVPRYPLEKGLADYLQCARKFGFWYEGGS